MIGIDEIIIDKALLKAIGADSRIQILKAVSLKRKTQSELAEELKLSQPTILEHLDYLMQAGLIIKVDEGRKWKYYKLTKKGEALINQRKTPIMAFILLSLGTVLGIFAVINLFGGGFGAFYTQDAQFAGNGESLEVYEYNDQRALDAASFNADEIAGQGPMLMAKSMAVENESLNESQELGEEFFQNDTLGQSQNKQSMKLESLVYGFLIVASIYLIYKGSKGLKTQKI